MSSSFRGRRSTLEDLHRSFCVAGSTLDVIVLRVFANRIVRAASSGDTVAGVAFCEM